jgi:hypothetical protein
MIYFPEPQAMKKTRSVLRLAMLLAFGVMLATLAALASGAGDLEQGRAEAANPAQATATPTAEGVSEIGSTDGIVLMGFMIVLIVVIPALWQRATRRRT